MFKNLKKRSEGFTIIEAMIVLAIAGLIMLIVFLAVPGLQRSQRNTARKNDIARVGAAVIDWYANNPGSAIATAPATSGLSLVNATGSLAQYNGLAYGAAVGANTLTISQTPAIGAAAMVTGAANANLTALALFQNGTCGAAGAVSYDASNTKVAIQYLLETNGTATPYCVQAN
ncbi:MAG: prepilin-type N-terminal cleavage/methylation domain-containing protein [Candidatus Saccharibacteria bacterium]